MEIKCPHCGSINEIDKEYWPKDCSTSEQWICGGCEDLFAFGVTCEIEIR